MDPGFVWQCLCGYMEHNEMPEDCPKCLRVGSFKQIPEDMIDEKVEEEILSQNLDKEDDDDQEEIA